MTISLSLAAQSLSAHEPPDGPAAGTPENPLVKQAYPSAVTSDNVAATSTEALQATGIAATPADAAQPGSPDSGQSGPPANGWSPAGILASGWARLLPGPKITGALPGTAEERTAEKWTAPRWA
jgi:hypothetical protein